MSIWNINVQNVKAKSLYITEGVKIPEEEITYTYISKHVAYPHLLGTIHKFIIDGEVTQLIYLFQHLVSLNLLLG